MHVGPPHSEAASRRRFAVKPRTIVIAVAVLGVLALIVVVLFASTGKGKPPNEAEAARRLTRALSESQDAALTTDGVIDAARLNKALEKDLAGYIVDLAASDDGRMLGAAARPEAGSTCVLAWTAVGGAKSATVTDPNLPCVGEVALAATR